MFLDKAVVLHLVRLMGTLLRLLRPFLCELSHCLEKSTGSALDLAVPPRPHTTAHWLALGFRTKRLTLFPAVKLLRILFATTSWKERSHL